MSQLVIGLIVVLLILIIVAFYSEMITQNLALLAGVVVLAVGVGSNFMTDDYKVARGEFSLLD